MPSADPSPLARDIAWLHQRLDEVEAAVTWCDLDRVRAAAREMLVTAAPASTLRELRDDEMHAALKLLTIRFRLRNKAEQLHIVRVNRQRQRAATVEKPRSESLAEAVGELARAGLSSDRLDEILAALDIRPTLTAHPTESRRRSVIRQLTRIAECLMRHEREPLSDTRVVSEVRQELALMLATDEVRSRRLDVIDEVRNGLHYLGGAIWDAVPDLYHDLTEAIATHYGAPTELPVFLRYRSWIGGDRDGNPNVTAALTTRALAEMRAAALDRYAAALEQLRRMLTLSDRRVAIDPDLRTSIDRDESARPLDPDLLRHLRHEPFRVKIHHMQARLGGRRYTSRDFLGDLQTLRGALRYAGLHEVADRGPLGDMLIRVRTFGFHLAALDIRQHSRVHEAAVAELFRLAGVTAGYGDLDVTRRVALLRAELRTARPLVAGGTVLSPETRELLDALRVFADTAETEPEAVGSYIISMAHDVSDVLEVMVLLREVGLWTIVDGVVRCPIDIAPLFETVDDLGHAGVVMSALFAEPAYASQLDARGRFQEIMLGYSDSNKDGGYWAANWRLHRAQDDLARVCRAAGVSFRFFHGRGGTVARGGGRAHRAILASPASSRTGQIRFTEQGEVISFRYALPALAHRHLEQIVNAMILATAGAVEEPTDTEAMIAMMEELAEVSRTTYRALIDDPAFWPWFTERSPVLHIGELPLASRPISRAGGANDFDNLRAIPWVFAWTQMRYNTPGWYGIGTAFATVVMTDDDRIALSRDAYRTSGSFRAFIDNAQQEMARARLDVARWYAGDGVVFHDRLAEEFHRAEHAILAITGQRALLDNNPVIQQSIRERNPDTDAINALQVELLRRWRDADEPERDGLRSLILLSVNALAAAMQSTG